MKFPPKRRAKLGTCFVHKLSEDFVKRLADARVILRLKSNFREINITRKNPVISNNLHYVTFDNVPATGTLAL